MAISTRSAGTWEGPLPNATSHQFAIPTHQTGDLLLLRFFLKPYTASPSIDQGWTIFGNGAGGSTANGNGVGSVYGGFAFKLALSASETGPTLTFGVASSPAFGVIDVYQLGAGEGFSTPVGIFKGYAAGTSISVTMDSNPGVTAGDLCVAGFGVADNITTTVPTFTQAGITWNTVTEWPATALSTATGNDGSGDGCYRIANTGTASAAPVLTLTQSASEEGIAIFARLRVSVATNAPAEIITVSGAAAATTGKVVTRAATTATATGASLLGASGVAPWSSAIDALSGALDASVTTGGGGPSGPVFAYAGVATGRSG